MQSFKDIGKIGRKRKKNNSEKINEILLKGIKALLNFPLSEPMVSPFFSPLILSAIIVFACPCDKIDLIPKRLVKFIGKLPAFAIHGYKPVASVTKVIDKPPIHSQHDSGANNPV